MGKKRFGMALLVDLNQWADDHGGLWIGPRYDWRPGDAVLAYDGQVALLIMERPSGAGWLVLEPTCHKSVTT